MKERKILAGVLTAFAMAGLASAQSGTLGISCDVEGSINLTFVTDASGLAVTGTTTSTGALPFSTVSMFGGSVPTNVTKTLTGVASFTLSTPFDVRVDLANQTSSNYTLTALLATADSTNTWLIGATNISTSLTPVTLTATGAYATAVPYTLHITVPASEVTGLTISNSIGFTATAN